MQRRKIYTTSVDDATKKPQIARLARRAGVNRISAEAYAEIRGRMRSFLESIIKVSVYIRIGRKKLTVSLVDVRLSAQTFGLDVAASGAGKYSVPAGGARKKKNALGRDDAKTRFVFDRVPFEKWCRSIGQGYSESVRFTDEAFGALQMLLESFLHRQLAAAVVLMNLTKSATLTGKMVATAATTHTSLSPVSCGVIDPVTTLTSIYKVLKLVHPDMMIKKSAKDEMMKLLSHVAGLVISGANKLLISTGKKTMGAWEIQTGLQMAIGGYLGQQAMSEGTKAFTKYNVSLAPGPGPRKSTQRAARAGLTLSVPVAEKILRGYGTAARVSATAPVYLAGVLEYICAEILELAGNATRDDKKATLAPKHVMQAIRRDEELSALFMRVSLSPGD